MSTREWMYLDGNGAVKGPVPAMVLIRLLEKNLGVSGETSVWKSGMEKWLRMSEVEPFATIVAFQNMQWFYIESGTEQRGPVSSRLIIHKLREGDIDGLTLVYNATLGGEWTKLSDIELLKVEMQKIVSEEEAAATALANIDPSQQVFVTTTADGDLELVTHDLPSKIEHNFQLKNSAVISYPDDAKTLRKTFVADNGVHYVWDDLENDWIEDENPDVEELEEGAEEEEGGVNESRDSKVSKKQSSQALVQNDEVEGEGGTDHDNNDDSGLNDGEDTTNESLTTSQKNKRKRKRKKVTGPNLWIYITGLPSDITIEEIQSHFAKVGIIAINPLDQAPKIKLYRDEDGHLKGDASLCYNSEESLQMALEVLDGGYIRPNFCVTVTKAEFQSKTSGGMSDGSAVVEGLGGGAENGKRRPVPTRAQIKVTKSAVQQALAWNDEDDIGVSKKQALRIVVLEGMFLPSDFDSSTFSDELEQDVASECGKCGEIDKITVFSKNIRGIVIVKFKTSFAAQECIRTMNGRYFSGRRLRSYFWDGVANYAQMSSKQEEEEEKKELARIDEFGDWLEEEQNELPEEFRLVVES